jgi:toxin FitB
MIIFDTKMISEAIKPTCDPRVRNWLMTVDHREPCTTSINLLEVRSGISIMPDGRRKTELRELTEAYVAAVFSNRLLPFDSSCATAFADIHADMKRRGRAISFADCQIAAIAIVRACPVATRDTAPFLATGIDVINPWTDE